LQAVASPLAQRSTQSDRKYPGISSFRSRVYRQQAGGISRFALSVGRQFAAYAVAQLQPSTAAPSSSSSASPSKSSFSVQLASSAITPLRTDAGQPQEPRRFRYRVETTLEFPADVDPGLVVAPAPDLLLAVGRATAALRCASTYAQKHTIYASADGKQLRKSSLQVQHGREQVARKGDRRPCLWCIASAPSPEAKAIAQKGRVSLFCTLCNGFFCPDCWPLHHSSDPDAHNPYAQPDHS